MTLVLPGATETEFHEAATGGERHGPKGWVQSADAVARSIVRAIRRPRREVYPIFGARLMAILNEAWPGLVDFLVRRLEVRRTRPRQYPTEATPPPAP